MKHQKILVVRPSCVRTKKKMILVYYSILLLLFLVAHSMGGSRLTLVAFSFRKLRRSENVISVQRR